MMTPVEKQPTTDSSVAGSMPGTSSAKDTSEVNAGCLSVVAASTDDGKAQIDCNAGHQQVPFVDTHICTPRSEQAPAGTYFQPQPQPPPYAPVVHHHQPIATASVTYPWDRQGPFSQGLAVAHKAAATASATSASGVPAVWMPMPLVTTLCPPGLEYLAELSQLHYVEEIPPTQTIDDNRSLGHRPLHFSVRNTHGQQIYVTDTRMLELTTHFAVAFLDCTGQTRMMVKIRRNASPACCNGCCGTSALDGSVEAPPGTVIGTMEQRSSAGMLSFVIKNTEGAPVLYLETPDPTSCCAVTSNPRHPPYKHFAIVALDGKNIVGTYDSKTILPTSYNPNWLTNISLVFPPDLDIKVKATLVGAGIFLSCYFFGASHRERQRYYHHHHHHHHYHR